MTNPSNVKGSGARPASAKRCCGDEYARRVKLDLVRQINKALMSGRINGRQIADSIGRLDISKEMTAIRSHRIEDLTIEFLFRVAGACEIRRSCHFGDDAPELQKPAKRRRAPRVVIDQITFDFLDQPAAEPAPANSNVIAFPGQWRAAA